MLTITIPLLLIMHYALIALMPITVTSSLLSGRVKASGFGTDLVHDAF